MDVPGISASDLVVQKLHRHTHSDGGEPSREAAKGEEPSVKRRRTNKKRKINDKNTSSSKESLSDPVSLMLLGMTKKKIDEVGGCNIIKIIEKKVYESDLCKTNNRL